MEIETKIFKLSNTGNFSVEYIESQLKNIYMIIPLRWAIVEITEETILINCSYSIS